VVATAAAAEPPLFVAKGGLLHPNFEATSAKQLAEFELVRNRWCFWSLSCSRQPFWKIRKEMSTRTVAAV